MTFTSGQTIGAQHCITVRALDDTLYEENEAFNVALTASNPTEHSVRFTAGENVTTVTILRDPNDSMYERLCRFKSHYVEFMFIYFFYYVKKQKVLLPLLKLAQSCS